MCSIILASSKHLYIKFNNCCLHIYSQKFKREVKSVRHDLTLRAEIHTFQGPTSYAHLFDKVSLSSNGAQTSILSTTISTRGCVINTWHHTPNHTIHQVYTSSMTTANYESLARLLS